MCGCGPEWRSDFARYGWIAATAGLGTMDVGAQTQSSPKKAAVMPCC